MSEPTVQVDLTLRLTERNADQLLAVLNDKDFFPHVLSFITPWRDSRVIPIVKIDAFQFGKPEDGDPHG